MFQRKKVTELTAITESNTVAAAEVLSGHVHTRSGRSEESNTISRPLKRSYHQLQ
jgi:hypothetical protein